jgi:hypothetical protein
MSQYDDMEDSAWKEYLQGIGPRPDHELGEKPKSNPNYDPTKSAIDNLLAIPKKKKGGKTRRSRRKHRKSKRRHTRKH